MVPYCDSRASSNYNVKKGLRLGYIDMDDLYIVHVHNAHMHVQYKDICRIFSTHQYAVYYISHILSGWWFGTAVLPKLSSSTAVLHRTWAGLSNMFLPWLAPPRGTGIDRSGLFH